jgi:hypothetical protein
VNAPYPVVFSFPLCGRVDVVKRNVPPSRFELGDHRRQQFVIGDDIRLHVTRAVAGVPVRCVVKAATSLVDVGDCRQQESCLRYSCEG